MADWPYDEHARVLKAISIARDKMSEFDVPGALAQIRVVMEHLPDVIGGVVEVGLEAGLEKSVMADALGMPRQEFEYMTREYADQPGGS